MSDGIITGVHILRSKRKTFALQMQPEGLIVRVPMRATEKQIQDVLVKHKSWIAKQAAKAEERKRQGENVPLLSEDELRALTEKAKAYIPKRCNYYAPLVGVTYGRITIRHQKTLWGSCSAKGNLNFNCLLMLTPPEVIDSVVVHELCHMKQHNHSDKFYSEVLRVFPKYLECHAWLKEHGSAIIQRGLVP